MPSTTPAQRRRSKIAGALADLRIAGARLPACEAAWADLAPPDMKAQNLTPPMGRPPRPLSDKEQAEQKVTSISDPTGEAAVNGLCSAARQAEDKIDAEVNALVRAARKLADEISRYAIEMPLKARELQALVLAADPGCEIVARIPRPDGTGCYWEETYIEATDVGGVLPRPYRLGTWAQRFVRDHKRLPTTAEVTAHCEGRRVMVTA